MGYPDFEVPSFPWGGVFFAMTTIVLGLALMVVGLRGTDREKALMAAETRIIKLEAKIAEVRDFKVAPAYLELEIADSISPWKIYHITVRGTTGTMGQYELVETKIDEGSPDVD